MRHHVGLPGVRLGDDRAQLVHRIAGIADRIVRRRDAAARHHLDLGSALGQLIARGAPHIVDAVDHARDVGDAEMARAGLELVPARAEIAVSAGLRQCLAGGKDARRFDHAELGGLRQRIVGAAGIADRGEAAAQHAFQDRQRADHRDRVRHARGQREVDVRRHAVHVAVDQPRHQRRAAQVVGSVSGGGLQLLADVGDLSVGDHDVGAVAQRPGFEVEQARAAQNEGGHGFSFTPSLPPDAPWRARPCW